MFWKNIMETCHVCIVIIVVNLTMRSLLSSLAVDLGQDVKMVYLKWAQPFA